jgi:hypothetical protein
MRVDFQGFLARPLHPTDAAPTQSCYYPYTSPV